MKIHQQTFSTLYRQKEKYQNHLILIMINHKTSLTELDRFTTDQIFKPKKYEKKENKNKFHLFH